MVYKKQCGVTLLELTVVLLILIALAGLAVPYVGGTAGKALCDADDYGSVLFGYVRGISS